MADRRYSPKISYDHDIQTHQHQRDLVVSSTLVANAESFEKKGHSWFVESQVPSDLSVKVDDITFHVHKYPLLSRCGYLEQIDLQPSISKTGYELNLQSFPGGPETFETVAKFCYGHPISLTPRNTAPLRCAAEFLDMSEELEHGNLISKTESFLTFVVFGSWKDSITVLKSCTSLSPWAENLQIVRRCCDSIAWVSQETGEEQSQWLTEVATRLATLRVDYFKKIVTSMTLKDLKPDFIGSCVMMYAETWLLGNEVEMKERKWSVQAIQQGRKLEETGVGQVQEQRAMIETLVSLLPHQKDAVSCKFLLWMLKMAMVYSVSPALVSELEKRVGMVMENATVYDLLIPGYINGDQENRVNSSEGKTMYNVDSVLRILEYYLMNVHQQQPENHGKTNVSKLLDNYLAEIASDQNLSATKFQVIAECLPDIARPCDDGLYRAVDIYLKAHPSLSEHDRRRLCRVINCQKLSVDACSHAAQNDRLPLRTVMQVLFAEQVKLRTTLLKEHQSANRANTYNEENEERGLSPKEEIKLLKEEMEKMMILIEDLQSNHANLQQDCKYMKTKQNALSGWILGWNKLKKTTLFHGKLSNETENREGKEKEKRIASLLRLKRRQSMS